MSILVVILSHLSITRSLPDSWSALTGKLVDGLMGVDTFFVISGFLITLLLLKEKDTNGTVNLRHFYTRRALRIFPAFYTYLIFLAALCLLDLLAIAWKQLMYSVLYLQNFDIGGQNWYVAHTWSLSVEEQFYLIFPIVIIPMTMRQIKITWLVSMVVGSLMRSVHYKYPEYSAYFFSGFFMHFDLLVSGCLIAFLYHHQRKQLQVFAYRLPRGSIIAAIVAIWFFYMYDHHPDYDKLLIPLGRSVGNIAISVIIIFMIFRNDSLGFRLLNSSLLVSVGRVSYGLYLWQQFFISDSGFWITQFPQNLVALALVAVTSYSFIERPFLLLKRRFAV